MAAVTRVLSGAWKGYSRQAHKNPNVTQAITGGCAWAIGNTLTQNERHKGAIKPAKFDFVELAAFASYGVMLAPFGHKWYMLLDKLLAGRWELGFWALTGSKLAMDTFIFGPMHVAAMLTWTTLCTTRSLETVKDKLETKWAPCFKAEAGLWLPAQTINFTVVPVQHQQLFVNVVTVAESVVMSWICGSHEAEEDTSMTLEQLV